MRKLSESEFKRAGVHNAELGRITLADLVKTYSDHLGHHLRLLKLKRSALKVDVTKEHP